MGDTLAPRPRGGSEDPAQQQAELAHRDRLIDELRQELEDTNRGLIALHTELEHARRAETRLAAIVASSDDASFALDLACRIQTWNPGAQRLLGRTEAETVGASTDVLMSEEARTAFRTAVDGIRAERRAESYDSRWLRADGDEVDVSVSVSAMRDPEGALIGFAATARDITHQLAAQAELAAARADREVMADRDRIARDLHDMVIQRVFGAGLALQSITGRVERPDLAKRLTSVMDELDATIRELRGAIFNLHQPLQKAISLRAQVVDETGAATERLGFEPVVEFHGPVDAALPDETAVQLLAVLREALSNAVKHAHASAVTVSVHAGRDLLLEVTDNGRGLGQPTRSSGLTNLRRRAEKLGGTFEATGPATGGTRLRWRIPLEADAGH
ncbi:PAS domain-containing sensor histidine kinase [Streptomyces sp. NPDC047000]|uniref:PAS domain-containing sensor histidine kinase n=1 Tax=Streptomyces sp. NPDC047000 TaxID=3155474 RepID=UPI0033EE4651